MRGECEASAERGSRTTSWTRNSRSALASCFALAFALAWKTKKSNAKKYCLFCTLHRLSFVSFPSFDPPFKSKFKVNYCPIKFRKRAELGYRNEKTRSFFSAMKYQKLFLINYKMNPILKLILEHNALGSWWFIPLISRSFRRRSF